MKLQPCNRIEAAAVGDARVARDLESNYAFLTLILPCQYGV